jgi:hypothetical protein
MEPPFTQDAPGQVAAYASVHFGPTIHSGTTCALNTYVARYNRFQAGKPDNDILIYYPVYDEYQRSLLAFDGSATGRRKPRNY